MRILAKAALAVGILMALSTQSYAENASCDEAKAMSEKAAAYYKANGAEKAFATFMAKAEGFADRDLYVFAFKKDATYTVHAAKPVMVGKNAMDLKDATGKEFIKEIVNVKDSAWVDYKYPDPSDGNKVKDKKSWVINVGDHVVGVGCYVK